MIGSGIDQARDKAERLHAVGVSAADAGQLVKAARSFTRALTSLGLDLHGTPLGGPSEEASDRDRDHLAARLLLSLAFPTYELGHVKAGLEALDDAERVAARGAFPGLQVLVRGQHGLLLLRAGRPAEALPQLDRAVRLLQHAPPVDQCKIMVNRGETHHILGHIALAKTDFARAVELARAGDLPEFEFAAIHNLGFMEYLSGDLPRALELMPTVEQGTSDFQRGVVGMDRSKVLLSAGLFTEADRTLLDACQALQRTDLVQFLAEAELTRAEAALLADNIDLARSLSRRAAGRFRQRGNARSTALAELITLEADAASTRGHARLARTANALADRLELQRLTDKARMARLIAIEATLDSNPTSGGPKRGVAVPDRPRLRPGEPINLRLHIRLVRSRLAFSAGQTEAGRREVRRGLDELSDYQAGFGSFDLQTASAAHGVGLAALGINEAMAAHRAGVVLHLLERARAISSRVPAVRPPEDSEIADLLAQLRWVITKYDEDEAQGLQTEPLKRRRRQLEQQIRSRSWTLQGPRSVRRIPTTTELRGSLAGATIVWLFLLDKQVHGLVLDARSCTMRPLTTLGDIEEVIRRVNADLDALALDRIPEGLRSSIKASLSADLRTLDNLLLAPLGLPDNRVVLLPPGRLAALPWGLMPTLLSRPVTVAPSASAWLSARSRMRPEPSKIVAVAGPGLRRAEEEVESVARSWAGCLTLTRSAATSAAFLAAVDDAKLVHVAAHGHHERDSPLFSSIRLAGGPVVGYDFDRVTRSPELAVLSACDLGQATVRPGDEALGLTRALLHSGTSTVISGVAKVSDRGAARLMADFHRRLAGGAPPADALAIALAAADDPVPFVCFGAGW